MSRYEREIQVRFRDLDPMNHVNNAVYATYLEQARAGYYRDVVGEPLETIDTVLARLEIDFRRPITADDDVVVAIERPTLGTSSVTMEYEVRAVDGDDERVAATATTVQVLVDDETGESRQLPEEWRRRIEGRAE